MATQSLPSLSRIALVLLDVQLPSSGEERLERFDQIFRAAPQVPILILAGDQGVAIAKMAVQRGAQDFILKSRLDAYSLPKAVSGILERAANAEALFEEKERAQVTLVESAIEDSAAPIHDRLGRVTGAVMAFHDVSAARAMSQKMAYLAPHDALTDLPNRLLLNDRLTQAIAMACRQRHPGALYRLHQRELPAYIAVTSNQRGLHYIACPILRDLHIAGEAIRAYCGTRTHPGPSADLAQSVLAVASDAQAVLLQDSTLYGVLRQNHLRRDFHTVNLTALDALPQ